jgi:hypothetical protein
MARSAFTHCHTVPQGLLLTDCLVVWQDLLVRIATLCRRAYLLQVASQGLFFLNGFK